MMKTRIFAPFLMICLALAMISCATPPTEEMNRAQDAVFRAENDADAVRFAPNTLVRAREALGRMQTEADARRYDEALSFANEATNLAERAMVEGRTGAARARDEAANLIANLAAPLSETANALGAAQEQDLPLNYYDLHSDMDSAYQSYDDARRSLSAGAYGDALIQGQDTRALLTDINLRLGNAVQVASRKQ